MSINYHILNSTIVVNYDGKLFKIPLEDDLGKNVIECIRNNNLDQIPELVDIAIKLKKISNDKVIFEIIDGQVYSFGDPVPTIISNKIITFFENNIPFENLLFFWNNLKQNPSKEATADLYRFLEVNEFPITPDGYFIAYKRITKDFKDIHTKTIDHSIGSRPKMDRSLVCDDNQITCASGLHIASFEYANQIYGSPSDKNTILVEVKVHPKDVVSVPFDYNGAKARCCEYEIIRVIKEENNSLIVFGEEYNIQKVNDEEKCDDDDDYEDDDTDYKDDDYEDITKIFKIGNYNYTYKEITSDQFISEVNSNQFRKRKPSDIPNTMYNFKLAFYLEAMYSKRIRSDKFKYLCMYAKDGSFSYFVFEKIDLE
jgi:hypothetical protein